MSGYPINRRDEVQHADENPPNNNAPPSVTNIDPPETGPGATLVESQLNTDDLNVLEINSLCFAIRWLLTPQFPLLLVMLPQLSVILPRQAPILTAEIHLSIPQCILSILKGFWLLNLSRLIYLSTQLTCFRLIWIHLLLIHLLMTTLKWFYQSLMESNTDSFPTANHADQNPPLSENSSQSVTRPHSLTNKSGKRKPAAPPGISLQLGRRATQPTLVTTRRRAQDQIAPQDAPDDFFFVFY